jgi:hypothetical protein
MFKNETSIEDWEDIEVFPEDNKDEEVSGKTPNSNTTKLMAHTEFAKGKRNSALQIPKYEDSK